jgi:tRNA A-37 threonylcarbamoyl transferase component Bud32
LFVLGATPAFAQRVVVSDLAGESDEAGAVSILLRSMLQSGQRPAVHLDEMQRAFERTPEARRSGFVVDPGHGTALMKDLGADRLITGELARDDKLSLSIRVHAPNDQLLGAASVQSMRGDIASLALEAAKRVAKEASVDIIPVEASLGDLRPFVRASRFIAVGDAKAAADALRVAGRGVAQRIPAAKEIADVLWRNPNLPTDVRQIAAMAAGETQEAIKLGQGADARKNPEVVGETAQAELAAGDTKKAEKALASVKGAQTPAVQLARAQLDVQKGKKADAGKELTGLLDSTPPDPAALAYVAGLPPNALDGKTEGLAVTAAQRVAKSQPGVASMVGLRAAKGGQKGPNPMSLVNLDEMSKPDLSQVDRLLEGESENKLNLDPVNKSMLAAVQQRKTAKVVELQGANGGPASKTARQLDKTGKKEVKTVSPEIKELASKLQPALEAFAPFSERAKGTVEIHPMKGSNAPWSLYWVNSPPIGFALEHALSSPPYDMGVLLSGQAVPDQPSEPQLAKLAGGAAVEVNYLLLYKVTSSDGEAHVFLELYDVAEQKAYEFDDSVEGQRTGVTRLNPILIPAGVVLLVVVIVLGLLRVLRIGEVNVEIKRDPAAENESLMLLLSKKDKPPGIKDVSAFHSKMKSGGPKRTRLSQANATQRTSFPRVPVGTWFVHLYGTYEKGGEIREVPAGLHQQITVKRGETVSVKLELDPGATEYRIRVVDGEPIPGAILILDEERGKPVVTDKQGNAMLFIPKGSHVIHLEAKGGKYHRNVDATGGKVQVITFDLVRERRDAELAKGLELSQDEEDGWRPPPPAKAEHAPTQLSAGKPHHPPEPEDDGISLPEGFAIPAMAAGMPTGVEMPTQLQPGMQAGTAVAARHSAPAAARAPSAQAGLRRYQRIQELGRGAMGVVYKGRDTVLERNVAIKIVADEVRNNAQALEMFLQEGKAMAALNHPNLVTVFDQGVEANETFMVMEFIEGQTLESLMQAGKVPMDQLLQIADQICAGLSYAHGRRILHRDIKPANIFLTIEGVVKIGDFGLARAVQHARLTQTKVCGTPMYMSPEQIRGSGVDFRSDLYSVGCTLFELACGQPPFTTGEVMFHHMYTEPPKPSSLNPSLQPDFDKMIMACLAKDLNTRVASADELRKLIKPLRARYS